MLVVVAIPTLGLFVLILAAILTAGPEDYTRQHPTLLALPLGLLAQLAAGGSRPQSTADRALRTIFWGMILTAGLGLLL